MSVESDVRESLRSVEDPEMKISVIELGLILRDKVRGQRWRYPHRGRYDLNQSCCPIAPELMAACT